MEDNVEDSSILMNLLSFWILGLCNNFAYVIMLSAAEDILSIKGGKDQQNQTGKEDLCLPEINHRNCPQMSTGSVLLADILPALFIKIISPFIMNRIPFGIRHSLVIMLQSISFLTVAYSNNIYVGLTEYIAPVAIYKPMKPHLARDCFLGVVIASIGSGLGEVTYLSLSSHFSASVVASWSSGTGAAGIFGALAYALLTDSHMLALSPRDTLIWMLVIPVLFFLTYHYLLMVPMSIRRVHVRLCSTYTVSSAVNYRRLPVNEDSSDEEVLQPGMFFTSQGVEINPCTPCFCLTEERLGLSPRSIYEEKIKLVKLLLKFMIPLSIVYFGEYLIIQGLVQLLVFTCTQGFNLTPSSQFRWYQVLYQIGVFVSRSSSKFIEVPPTVLPFLSLLQMANACFFFLDAIYHFVPHIGIAFGFIFYTGLLGGASYVNTFTAIHKTISVSDREFSMGFASMSDSFGIVSAGFLAISTHNYICTIPL